MPTFRVIVDSPISRGHDWDNYCDADALPDAIRSRGDADDVSETWVVTAPDRATALDIARDAADELGVNIVDDDRGSDAD